MIIRSLASVLSRIATQTGRHDVVPGIWTAGGECDHVIHRQAARLGLAVDAAPSVLLQDQLPLHASSAREHGGRLDCGWHLWAGPANSRSSLWPLARNAFSVALPFKVASSIVRQIFVDVMYLVLPRRIRSQERSGDEDVYQPCDPVIAPRKSEVRVPTRHGGGLNDAASTFSVAPSANPQVRTGFCVRMTRNAADSAKIRDFVDLFIANNWAPLLSGVRLWLHRVNQPFTWCYPSMFLHDSGFFVQLIVSDCAQERGGSNPIQFSNWPHRARRLTTYPLMSWGHVA